MSFSSVADVLGWNDLAQDTVSILVGGKLISGWEGVQIHVPLEGLPRTFELETTEWSPDDASELTILAGATCQIYIGSEVVITGYVVTVTRSIEADGHTVRVSGASKSIDLTECSAIFDTYQLRNTDPVALANKLCAPFGIKAVVPVPFDTKQIDQFDVILTETPFEIIERVCRSAALLVYDDDTGNIILSRAGSELAASGFAEGENVERYSFVSSMAGRYSEISAVRQTTDVLYVSPDEADLGGQVKLVTDVGPLKDPGVARYRPLIIQTEMGDQGLKVTQQRVQWEINRRFGRSSVVELTCDSWFDGAGVIWGVNTLAPVSLPGVKCTPSERWLITDIVFRRDAQGTHADIVLMPKEGMLPEPVLLNPLQGDVGQAVRDQAGGGASSDQVTAEPLPDLTKP